MVSEMGGPSEIRMGGGGVNSAPNASSGRCKILNLPFGLLKINGPNRKFRIVGGSSVEVPKHIFGTIEGEL